MGTINNDIEVEDRFTHWIKSELIYRTNLYNDSETEKQKYWYKAQIGILETVIKQLPSIDEPYKEVTQEDIWNQADAAYKKHTPHGKQ